MGQEIGRKKAEGSRFRFGPGADDVEARLSKATRQRMGHILTAWDGWVEEQSLPSLWESSPILTPVKIMTKKVASLALEAAEALKRLDDADTSVGADHMRRWEYPRRNRHCF